MKSALRFTTCLLLFACWGCDPTEAQTINAVAVIADFADTRLEDMPATVPGAIVDEAGLRRRLDRLSDHWAWMSRGTQVMHWHIIRVTLDQPFSATAFSNWAAYREAVVEKTKAVIDFADYDADGDGLLDVTWIVAATQGIDTDYTIGGMATVAGAGTFVDGQAGSSVTAGATGNFNHEVGHCLGLPDIYGDYDSVSGLSLMSYSWTVPPPGFSAFDRYLLGWLVPERIDASTAGITLAPAEENLEAVLIPTADAFEYFLVEYRRQPAMGYGSLPTVGFDGLAIYHVDERVLGNGNNFVDPPLLELAPADGLQDANTAPTATDFWFPENTAMALPFTGRRHFTGTPVFNLTAVHRASGELIFDIELFDSSIAPRPNLLANAGFEAGGNGAPDVWTKGHSAGSSPVFAWETAGGINDSRCVRIDIPAETPANAWWSQTVSGLTVGATYELSGWVRGDAITAFDNATTGASLGIQGTWGRTPDRGTKGDFGWTQVAMRFEADSATIDIGARLGHWFSNATGTAWFDELSLAQL